jgi:hypothetical protein
MLIAGLSKICPRHLTMTQNVRPAPIQESKHEASAGIFASQSRCRRPTQKTESKTASPPVGLRKKIQGGNDKVLRLFWPYSRPPDPGKDKFDARRRKRVAKRLQCLVRQSQKTILLLKPADNGGRDPGSRGQLLHRPVQHATGRPQLRSGQPRCRRVLN